MSEQSNTMQSPEPEGGQPAVIQAARRSLPDAVEQAMNLIRRRSEAARAFQFLLTTSHFALRRIVGSHIEWLDDEIAAVERKLKEQPEGNYNETR